MMKEQALILLVDDDPVILGLMQEILSSGPYTVDIAHNGREAVERLQACTYDLVLTDMVMPEMQGLELLQHLRLHHPETLTIVFTGYANYQDVVAAVKLGAFDYLTKPLRAEILRHAIDRALEFRRLTRSQQDLEMVLQGAESLGWQALDLVSDTPEAAVLTALRGEMQQEQDLKDAGRRLLEAARRLVGATHGSIFLFDPASGLFSGLAAMGPKQEYRAGLQVPASSGLMGYLAAHPRPLLVSDLRHDSRFPVVPRRGGYHGASLIIIPLMGRHFEGVINLTDKEQGGAFTSRDLFLGWLLGRLLVEVLETRKAPEPPEPCLEDKSELEQLRQRLNLFEHLAIMGKLTLCVAHDLNNPLDGVRRYLSLALMKKDQPEEVERYLSEAQKGLQRMAASIKSLMFSAHPLKTPRTRDNLLNLLQDAVKIMMFQASDQKVQVSLNPPRELQQVVTDGDLYHVFLNIIKNALQAMPQGGHLHIGGRRHPEQVEITFEDTGAGLSPRELEQIFQPFYSTKEGTKGLGLGLPICQKILERQGGRLQVTSQAGQGTRVSIFLPQAVPEEGHEH